MWAGWIKIHGGEFRQNYIGVCSLEKIGDQIIVWEFTAAVSELARLVKELWKEFDKLDRGK